MSKTEKAPQEKLEGDITVALQTALGKPLTRNQVEQVYLLANDVARINDPTNEQPVPPLNQGLQSLLDETGLKASQIAPITALVASYHRAGSARDDVNSAIGTFKEVHKVELAEATKAKSTDFLASIVKDLEKTSGTRLNDSESTKVAELTSSLKNIGEPDGPERFSTALKEFTEMASGQVGNFTARIEEFHKNEPEKQALVTPVLEPFKVVGLNQQITTELEGLAGRKLDESELLKVSELSQSVGYIKDKDDLPTLTLCLNEVVKELTPEQAKPILDLVKNYHKDDVAKQELVGSVLEKVTLKTEPEIEVVAVDSLGSASVDEITKAIRDEVITKQQAYLQGEIAKIMTVEEGVAFNNKTPEEMRAYLGTEEGKVAVKEVMKTKEAQLAMNKIEVDGYKKVHETFKDSFKNVAWDQEPGTTGTKVRIAEIKNEAGEKIASLKETTVDAAPTQVTLEDGTTRTIKSYRQIDFPLNLDDGKGPAHLSMAVKDENGRNISAKDALYFTAHYDDNGKLTEVSSPVPVKFMGDGDDAIGYIERNGKVYTLPVTQGKYKEMMQEVAINNGLGVDVGQSVDSVSIPPRAVEQSIDSVSVSPRTVVGQELQEPEVQKKSEPVAIDPNALQTAKIVTIDPVTITATPTFAEELQEKKANLTKTDRGAEVYGYDKPGPKAGPDQEKPLTDAQKLQAMKDGLKKTDRGAEVYGYDKPGPKIDPDQVKPLTDAQKFEKELQDKKDSLKKTGLNSAEKVTTSPTIIKQDPKLVIAEELGDKPKETGLVAINIEIPPVKLEEPKLAKLESSHVEVVTINPITGKEIPKEVIEKVQEIREVLDTSLPRAPEINNGKKALEMLNGKSSDQAIKEISTAISKGDEKLVKAMMDIINKPPEDAKIPQVGKVALITLYKDQIDKTKNMEPKEKAQVQRAAGAIANKAGVDHKQQLSVLGPKQTTSQTR